MWLGNHAVDVRSKAKKYIYNFEVVLIRGCSQNPRSKSGNVDLASEPLQYPVILCVHQMANDSLQEVTHRYFSHGILVLACQYADHVKIAHMAAWGPCVVELLYKGLKTILPPGFNVTDKAYAVDEGCGCRSSPAYPSKSVENIREGERTQKGIASLFCVPLYLFERRFITAYVRGCGCTLPHGRCLPFIWSLR